MLKSSLNIASINGVLFKPSTSFTSTPAGRFHCMTYGRKTESYVDGIIVGTIIHEHSHDFQLVILLQKWVPDNLYEDGLILGICKSEINAGSYKLSQNV
ncbi:hypothetical protein HG531_000945 [Fusarium graminearum]|nr:hypothetical protein HG531_000945 [Fusarium graminearum]